jgi:hypothetical protein
MFDAVFRLGRVRSSSPLAWSWVLLPLDFHFAKGRSVASLSTKNRFCSFLASALVDAIFWSPYPLTLNRVMNRFSLCHRSLVKFRLDFSFQRSTYSLAESSPPVYFLRRSALPHEPIHTRARLQVFSFCRQVLFPARVRNVISGSGNRSDPRPDQGRLPCMTVGPLSRSATIKGGQAGAREPTFAVPSPHKP